MLAQRGSAHVQLDDDPRAPIQQSFGDEFRRHNGVVTTMMFYRRRASPKHYNDMIEVEYGGRGRTIVVDNIVAVLRRSPATVVHQDRHHAVVLTELFPDTLLDRSPGIVIELNVC